MTGLNLAQFKAHVVKPTLEYLGGDMASIDAINLVTGTAIVESQLMYLLQVPSGIAHSLWQIEQLTYTDVLTRSMNCRPRLRSLINGASYGGKPDFEQLSTNLKLACIIARLKYWLLQPALPTNAAGMSAYHKQWYNTSLGAANASENVKYFQAAISA